MELAQLNYLLPRLTGHGAAMSRLGGGIGTRGPGETKLETDRRRIYRRIRKLESDLDARARRDVASSANSASRCRWPPSLWLDTRTRASRRLFNRLTNAAVLADAKMFATLDPTVRHITLPSRRRVLVSDTVGFIRNLPTTLVKAFRATLEEVTEASLLLHVVDVIVATHRAVHEQGSGSAAWNWRRRKDPDPGAEQDGPAAGCDGRYSAAAQRLQGAKGPAHTVGVSAREGAGIDALLELIDRALETRSRSLTCGFECRRATAP